MTRLIDPTPQAFASPFAATAAPAGTGRLSGEVVYMYAFDVAYEMSREPVRQVLGQPVASFVIDASKRAPRQAFFYRPQMVRLPPLERLGPRGPVRLERSVKILPVGAISITIRAAFAVDRVEDLVCYHDLRFSDGTYLYDDVRALAEEVRQDLMPYLIRPVDRLGDEEAYTVFCFAAPLISSAGHPVPTEEWLRGNRRAIAAMLTEETNPARLSEQESQESTGKYLSYYDNDLVVIDWDAALIVEERRNFEEVLYTMELANVQLAELEAYDHLLDAAVERAYRDLAPAGLRWGSYRRRGRRTGAIQRELREIRIDLARLSDELSNITKFFGDWHLARIYQSLSARFHLGDWHHTIDEKLKTLDDLYNLLRADVNTRWMFVLEIAVVILFVLELVNSFIRLH